MNKALLTLACLAALGGCAPKTLQLPPTLPDTLSEPRGAREVTTLLDLDHVNDVAQGGGYVFVATDHGLLVFDGEGGMARLIAHLCLLMEPQAGNITTMSCRTNPRRRGVGCAPARCT